MFRILYNLYQWQYDEPKIWIVSMRSNFDHFSLFDREQVIRSLQENIRILEDDRYELREEVLDYFSFL